MRWAALMLLLVGCDNDVAVAKPLTPEKLAAAMAPTDANAARADAARAAAAKATADAKALDDRKALAKLLAKTSGVQAEVVGPDQRTLGVSIRRCDDAALLELLRAVRTDNLKALGFNKVYCVDGADQQAEREL